MPRREWWCLDRVIDGIEIFAVDLSPHPDREERALDYLDEAELARFRRFRVEPPGRQYLLSRSALRILLGERLNQPNERLAFDRLRYGKPYATVDGQPAPISFNLSHSADFGLISICRSRHLGIDVECRRPLADLDGIADKVFHAGERRILSSLTGQSKTDLFYRLWTCKEALIKAKGTGFSYDPIRFGVPDAILKGGLTARFGFPEDAGVAWILTDIGTQSYAAAIAYSDQPK